MSLTIECVHCGSTSAVSAFPQRSWNDPLLLWVSDQGLRSWISSQQNNVVQLLVVVSDILRLQTGDSYERWKVARCEGCKKPLFIVTNDAETEILRSFPPLKLEPPPDLPSGVGEDFAEGQLCLAVGAHKAAVAMFRRSLQAAAREKKANGDGLVQQLESLGDQGLVNSSLLEVAHQVRHFGNYGAHPDKDGLGEVSANEAAAVRDLTWQVLEDIYINPARVSAIKDALRVKKASSDERSKSAPGDAPPTA